MGFVKLNPDGKYMACDIILEDGTDIRSIYSVALNRAQEHLATNEVDPTAHFDSFCLILSDQEMASIKQVLSETRGRIAEIAKRKESKSQIAFLNINFFKASH